MTIADTGSRAQYLGDGATVAFAFPYRFFVSSDLLVYLTASGVDTLQTSGTHYSVSNTGTEDGGTVTMVTAPASGETLTILRAIPASQSVDYQANDAFPAETHEAALDRLTLLVQQRQEELARAIRVSATINPISDFTPTEGAVITFDSGLNPIVGPLVGDISSAATSAATATAAAAAASASETAAAASAVLAADAQQNLFDNYAGQWADATAYTQGQWVESSGSSYLCTVDHTSATALNEPGSGSDWGSYWALFAAKGAPGAGTGDVLAANSGSEYTAAAGSFRNNVSAMLRAITPRASLNFQTDTSLDTSIYNIGTGNTKLPDGSGDGDSIISSKIDASNYNYLTFGGARAWIGRRLSNVNTWVELATLSGRGGVLLAEKEASASAALDFTEFDNTIYSVYEFEFENVVPVSDGVDLLVRVSADSGSSYDAGASDYQYGSLGLVASGSQTGAWSTAATFMQLTGAVRVGNAAAEFGVTGKATLYSAGDTASHSRIKADLSYDATNGAIVTIQATGRRLATAENDAIRFLFSSGNIATGKIRMFGHILAG